jgi:hypothetical protein
MGRGIGWVDVHLLASAKLSGCGLWLLDRRLAVNAREQGVMEGLVAGCRGASGKAAELLQALAQGLRADTGLNHKPCTPRLGAKHMQAGTYRPAPSQHLYPMTFLSVFLPRMVTSLASSHPADLKPIHSTHVDSGAHRQSLHSAIVCSSPVFPSPAVQPAAR